MPKKYILTFSIVAVLGCYLGFTFYSRWRDNRDLVQRIEERRLKQQPQVVEAYRGTELKIVFFYASPGAITRGQKTQLCYGVINSDRVRIEPAVENVWPAVSNCVNVAPKSSTVYSLIAEDVNGNKKKADAAVEVF